jgi:hypothetical protein
MSVKTSQIYGHRNLMLCVAVWVLLRRVQRTRLRFTYPLPEASASVINRNFMTETSWAGLVEYICPV